MNQNEPNHDTEILKSLLSKLSMTQIRFIIARLETKTDKEAAAVIDISPSTVKSWNSSGDKAIIDQAIDAMRFDGMITAVEIRRRNLAKAMAVKVAGLDCDDEVTRQKVATEIIEWEMGRATQRQELTGADGGAVIINIRERDSDG